MKARVSRTDRRFHRAGGACPMRTRLAHRSRAAHPVLPLVLVVFVLLFVDRQVVAVWNVSAEAVHAAPNAAASGGGHSAHTSQVVLADPARSLSPDRSQRLCKDAVNVFPGQTLACDFAADAPRL
ncbi:hypothetical protein GCM10027590_44330 [Nocardiopsis nanhaiensis]